MSDRPGLHTTACALLLALAVVCSTSVRPAESAQARSIRIPAWAAKARCTLQSPDKRAPATPLLPADITCSNPAAILSCDGSGVEPLDVPLASVCETRAIPFVRARNVTVKPRTLSAVVVEWIELGAPAAVRTIARRPYAPADTIQVPVSAGADRLVRFSRAGASPVTVSAKDLLIEGGWKLPSPVTGGEVVAVLEPAPVLPLTLRVTPPALAAAARAERLVVGFTGLAPGAHRVEREYSPGFRGAPAAAEVAAEKSTVVFLAKESVGGISVSVDPFVCGQAQEYGINVLAPPERGRGAPRVEPIVRIPKTSECVRTVLGLPPGTYQAFVRTVEDGVVAEDAVVSAQAVSPVFIAAPTVFVSGQILVNEKPFIGKILFTSPGESPGRERGRTQTDPGGWYSLTLGEPGAYRLQLYRRQLLVIGQSKEVRLHAGENHVDWHLSGGSLTVRVNGWDQRTAIHLYLRSPDATAHVIGSDSMLTSNEDYPVVLDGLPLGTYTVRAVETRRRTTAEVTVKLDKSKPEQNVDLDLRENTGLLTLRDESGAPVAGVRVAGIQEVQPGVFSLAAVHAGQQLVIVAPGFVPACRVVPGDTDMDVTLARGAPVVLEFSRPFSGAPAPGDVLNVPGSDCAVRLLYFVPRPLAPGLERPRFAVDHFPVSGSLVFAWRGVAQHPIGRDATGTVRITLPDR